MSVLIKGMEMPKDCPMCPLSHWNHNDDFTGCQVVAGKKYAVKNDHEFMESSSRPDWCPLVPVPPHGRLGDLDNLEQMFADIDHAPYSGFDGENAFYSAADAAQIIRLAPTIIPAEEGET